MWNLFLLLSSASPRLRASAVKKSVFFIHLACIVPFRVFFQNGITLVIMDRERYFCTMLRLHEHRPQNMLVHGSRSFSRHIFPDLGFRKGGAQAPCLGRRDPASSSPSGHFHFGKTSRFHPRP